MIIQGVEVSNPNPNSLEIRSDMLPQIFPKRFYTTFDNNPADILDPIPTDWVIWGKKGDKGYEMVEKIDRVRKGMASHWHVIKPYYEHWKTGQEVPENGTQLSQLPGMTPDMIDRCQQIHIRTIEDAAQMGEEAIFKIGFGARALKERAQAWIAQRPNRVTDDRIGALEAKLAEAMKALEMANAPKKRGRKPKEAA